ncbi:MAG: GntR family transcriptional regulator [Planctomycetota bacterium]|jgi:DNA-binding GntR family transcriptional regulator
MTTETAKAKAEAKKWIGDLVTGGILSSSSGLLRAEPQHERAYCALRRLLILQQIPQGERLTEAEWAERLNVNRAALREALARLRAEGFITSGPNGGYFVPSLTMEDIRDVLAVRIVIEAGAIEMVCQSGLNSPDRLRSLKEACDAQEWLALADYHFAVVEADHRFHLELVRASGSERLILAYRHVPLPIIPPAVTWGEPWLATVRRTIEEHRAILEAVLDGDADRGRQILRVHLAASHLLRT